MDVSLLAVWPRRTRMRSAAAPAAAFSPGVAAPANRASILRSFSRRVCSGVIEWLSPPDSQHSTLNQPTGLAPIRGPADHVSNGSAASLTRQTRHRGEHCVGRALAGLLWLPSRSVQELLDCPHSNNHCPTIPGYGLGPIAIVRRRAVYCAFGSGLRCDAQAK